MPGDSSCVQERVGVELTGMEIDKAVRESGDERLKRKYDSAVFVILRALALYSSVFFFFFFLLLI